MSSSPEDVLGAVQTSVYRGEPATTDAVAGELATTRDDIAPVLVAVMRRGGRRSVKHSDGPSVWVLTGVGERAIADA